MTYYANWRDVPADRWHWKNFQPRELACRGTGSIFINADAIEKLQRLRALLDRPLIITSAYRSPSHNEKVKGAKDSLHMRGIAFDIRMDNHNPTEFEAAAKAVGFTGFGYYPKSGFMHIDTGPERTWGEPFPISNSNLPPEPPRRPETLKEDRDVHVLAGVGGIAAVSELITVGKEGSGLLETLSTVSPLVLLIVAAVGYVVWRHIKSKPL